jgi:hypothetical protein
MLGGLVSSRLEKSAYTKMAAISLADRSKMELRHVSRIDDESDCKRGWLS